MDWQLAGTVIFVGIVIVFVVLFFLIAVCYLSGAIFKSLDRFSQTRAQKKTVSPAVTTKAQASVPEVEDGIEKEVVAAIMAAVVVAMGGDAKNYAVKSIRRNNVGRPVWAQAGLLENTRPF